MENIIKLLNDLQASISSLQAQLSDAQAAVAQVAKENYDKGFADGVASVGPGDKIYSQVEMDAALQPLKDQVAALQVQLDGVPAQIEAAVAAGKAELKAELKAAYEAAQASESASESDFGSKLS
jgi:hypothetical protein